MHLPPVIPHSHIRCGQISQISPKYRTYSAHLPFLGQFFHRQPERVCAWAGSSGQGNFELAANSDYNLLGSADPSKSLRKRRISKLPLSAHKVLPGSETVSRLLCVGKWKIYTITTATFSTPQSQSKKGALMESRQGLRSV